MSSHLSRRLAAVEDAAVEHRLLGAEWMNVGGHGTPARGAERRGFVSKSLSVLETGDLELFRCHFLGEDRREEQPMERELFELG